MTKQDNFEEYLEKVRSISKKENVISLANYNHKNNNQLDYKVSLYHCFNNNVDEKVAGGIDNLELIKSSDNSKNNHSSMSVRSLHNLHNNKENRVVVDTNILIDDAEIIKKLIDKKTLPIIPYTVLAELDNLKRNPDLKRAAQGAIKTIRHFIQKIAITNVPALNVSPDEIIINSVDENSKFMTNDIGAQAIAMARNVELIDTLKDDTVDYDYNGYQEIDASPEYNKTFCSLKEMQLSEFEHNMKVSLKLNEYCIIHITSEKYDIWKNINGTMYRITQKMGPYTTAGVKGVQPLDAIQMCALDAVFDPVVPLTVIDGKLGCLVGGEQLEVKIDAVYVSKKELHTYIEQNAEIDSNKIETKLDVLVKNNVINIKNNMFDLTEFGPSLLIYFKLNKQMSSAYIDSLKHNAKESTFRYWLCYYEFNTDKAYKKFKFIRENKYYEILDSALKEYTNTGLQKFKMLILDENTFERINTDFGGRCSVEYWTFRGCTESEAEEKVREIQKQDNCVEKYDIKKGTEVFDKDIK